MSQPNPNPDASSVQTAHAIAQPKDATLTQDAPSTNRATLTNRATPSDSASLKRRAVTYLLTTAGLMAALYALAYHSWDATGLAGRLLVTYLEAVAQVSAASLRVFGEQITITDATVSGRFSYVVVVDCAALDVQALFVAAVLAFPSPWKTRLVGLACGVAAIFSINITRLVVLYYAGASSLDLFNTLHEEVFVLVIVALVCGLFLMWARWATLHSPLPHTAVIEMPALGESP